MPHPQPPIYRLRIVFPGHGMVGPGKAELLQRIRETGSIAAAGRAMGMSYKRAWQLVETMNAMFAEPVVTSVRGGARGGGATLTATGAEVLAAYLAAVEAASAAAAPAAGRLEALLGSAD
ncbi:molybdate transport system regulatory protein [Palleronia marisminoris]|uniref:Molybdenum-pterin-binding protein MopA n=1 Tax=Palleronia marisminoris TaxID=315423 RepID=A0A1Y5TAG8_9RHOB|nr:LysR family transcriptional regulator [Palleronia marisminoris]SFH17214.1 molybdate transport system regulatory protein [Palleronia marisminoris]SLN55939.1 Molybdenum-pterin-binding protein MopA [Palleronia marisminoris]